MNPNYHSNCYPIKIAGTMIELKQRVALMDEPGVTGSVVWDAAVGFGLRLR